MCVQDCRGHFNGYSRERIKIRTALVNFLISLKLIPIEKVTRAGFSEFELEIPEMLKKWAPESPFSWQFEFKCIFNDKLKN